MISQDLQVQGSHSKRGYSDYVEPELIMWRGLLASIEFTTLVLQFVNSDVINATHAEL